MFSDMKGKITSNQFKCRVEAGRATWTKRRRSHLLDLARHSREEAEQRSSAAAQTLTHIQEVADTPTTPPTQATQHRTAHTEHTLDSTQHTKTYTLHQILTQKPIQSVTVNKVGILLAGSETLEHIRGGERQGRALHSTPRTGRARISHNTSTHTLDTGMQMIENRPSEAWRVRRGGIPTCGNRQPRGTINPKPQGTPSMEAIERRKRTRTISRSESRKQHRKDTNTPKGLQWRLRNHPPNTYHKSLQELNSE